MYETRIRLLLVFTCVFCYGCDFTNFEYNFLRIYTYLP